MPMKKLKHNKYKNTGLIFGVLSKLTINEALNKKTSTGLNIIKKYFSNGTELSKELKLYNIIQEINSKTTIPDKVLDLIIEKRNKTIDKNKLAQEKFNIIGDIKKNYNLEESFSNKLYNYKVVASIYKLFEYDALESPVEYVEAKKFIIESLEAKPIIVESAVEADSYNMNVRKIALRIAIDKFNEKYSKFNPQQRNLLRKYMTESHDKEKFRNYVYGEVANVKKALIESSDLVTDKVLKIKISECVNLLGNILSSTDIKIEHLGSLLKYYELIDEIKLTK
jgi:hypothetical protein